MLPLKHIIPIFDMISYLLALTTMYQPYMVNGRHCSLVLGAPFENEIFLSAQKNKEWI